MKTGVLVLARMGSTRLPGKVMMRLKDKPVLQHVVERCSRAEKVDQVIVVCTDAAADKTITDFCEDNGYSYYVGKGEDVVNQIYEAAKHYKLDLIVDITADCPLIDPVIIDNILYKMEIEFLKHKHIKKFTVYGSNLFPRTYPDGFDVQIYATSLMRILNLFLHKNSPCRRNGGWNIPKYFTVIKVNEETENPIPTLRLTLDTRKDYKLINKIFKQFEDNTFSFEDVRSVLTDEMIAINKNVQSTTPGL